MCRYFELVIYLVFIGFLASSSNIASANEIVKFELSDPEKVVFEYDDFVFGDDYVHFTSTNQQVPIDATGGQTITWDYNYENAFLVNSGDKADLTLLKLFGHGDGSEGQIDVSFWLTDSEHKKIQSTVLNWSGLKWAANTNLVLFGDWPLPNGNDKLGILEDIVVGDFHLEVKVKKGELIFGGGSVDWEVGDISAVPEPNTFVLLTLGFAAIGFYRYQLQRKSNRALHDKTCITGAH